MRYTLKTLWLALLLTLAAPVADAAEPFYANLLRQGSRDYSSGRYEEAARKLRIACFGLLDEPELLTEGLVRLSLAQAGSGDQRAFVKTWDRLAEIEIRFSSYAGAAIPDDLRRDFEEQSRLWISSTELARAPGLQSMTAAPATVALQAAAQTGSDDTAESPESLLTEALRLFSSARPARATGIVDQLLALEPENEQGLCLSGQIGARSKSCSRALAGLPSCPDLRTNIELASFYLKCLIDGNDIENAQAFTVSLGDSLQTRRRIARLARQLPPVAESADPEEPAQADESFTGGETPDSDATISELPGEDPPADQPPEPGKELLSQQDEALLVSVRNRVHAATSLDDLEEPARIAGELAAANPHSPEVQFLAGEIAYRGSRWAEAVDFFKRGGIPGTEYPLLRFYAAVSLFEAGLPAEAAEVMEQALPLLEPTEFVNRYAARILGGEGASE